MSAVSSTSELTTKEIVEQAIQDYHMSILPYLAKGNNGYSETPIGAIQFFDDDTAPSGWLVADGTIYNISDYPFLANHYERVHGSKNYYGGNGTTTFAVPDWRGEFFRASGPNAHPNQGDGAAVGEHQDATEMPDYVIYDNGNILYGGSTSFDIGVSNSDSNISVSSPIVRLVSSSSISGNRKKFTSRPTCTSGLCCIKAVPAGINYSLEEQECGTWVDGKKLYRKTIDCGALPNATDKTVAHNISNLEHAYIIFGSAHNPSNNFNIPLPFVNGSYKDRDVQVDVLGNNIRIDSHENKSVFTQSYVTLLYTKTID